MAHTIRWNDDDNECDDVFGVSPPISSQSSLDDPRWRTWPPSSTAAAVVVFVVVVSANVILDADVVVNAPHRRDSVDVNENDENDADGRNADAVVSTYDE